MISRVVAVPFRMAHVDLFEPHPDHEKAFLEALPHLPALAETHQCDSFLLDGRILFVGGCVIGGPGLVEAFIYPSVYAMRYPRQFFREAKKYVDMLKAVNRRVQCWGEDTELSRRWLKHLGFQHEGTLPSYTVDGRTMLIWGKV